MTKQKEGAGKSSDLEKLTDDQVELLQEFIDNTENGVLDAMDLIPEGYRQYFKTPTTHGKQFKRAVQDRRFKNITLIDISIENHQRYLIEKILD